MRLIFFLLVFIFVSGCSTKIIIDSTPAGAKVSEAVSGDIGVTPTEIVYSSGACEERFGSCYVSFYFSKPGYEGQRVERIVDGVGAPLLGEEVFIHAFLKEIKTELSVRGFPTFADYKISYQQSDGSWHDLALTGKGGGIPSLRDEEPWQGKDYLFIKLNFESPGYKPFEKRIRIQKGEQKLIEYVLEEYALFGTINSQPTGVDVYERSLGYLGRTPIQIRIPYDQLVRISPQRRNNLQEPVYLHLKLSKEGYADQELISSIGEIDELEEPEDFSISGTLKKTQSEKKNKP